MKAFPSGKELSGPWHQHPQDTQKEPMTIYGMCVSTRSPKGQVQRSGSRVKTQNASRMRGGTVCSFPYN